MVRLGRLGSVAIGIAAALGATACRRRSGTTPPPDAGTAQADLPDLRCVGRPEGCVWCQGRGSPPPMLDAEDPRPLVCDPKDDENCVEFCSRMTAECALPWRGAKCLAASEEEFRRQLFWRDNGERPEASLAGRVVDDAGKRIEGARIRVWHAGTPIADQVSGKDGLYRVPLRAGPWKYTVRVQSPGLASEIAEVALAPERPGAPQPPPRAYRMTAEVQIRGKVVSAAAEPVPGVVIHALRTPEDFVEAGEGRTGDDGSFVVGGLEAGRRYVLRAARFGWATALVKAQAPGAGPGPRVMFKMEPTGVIRGQVVDADGEAEPNAMVLALLSAPIGAPNAPILRWTADARGRFAEDRFAPGTYYLWARRGEMMVYPPVRIELGGEGGLEQEARLQLSQRGARVSGRVAPREGFALGEETRVVLHSRSPLSLPRDPAGEVARDGRFLVVGALPGRYEIAIRSGPKALGITRGPREVEVPIEAGSAVELADPIVVRPQLED